MAEPKWGYEGQGKAFDVELNRKVLFGALIAVVVTCLAGFLVGRGVFDFLVGEMEASDPPAPLRVEALERRLPPEPWLQSHPELDLRQMREADEHSLNSYAWEDEEQGIARVPIDRAMGMVAEEGLPVWPEVDADGQPIQTSPGVEQ